MREKIECWIGLQGTFLLRISIGLIYCLFGILKFFPNLSPAEDLATTTVHTLTFGLLSPELSMILLALWETAIGFLLLLNILRPLTIALVLLHIAGTFTPLLLFPELTFTLVGQYILKNIIIVSSMLVISTSALKEKKENENHC
ncbi:DoxX family membrane protein [Christiangramia sp.]|uniref:DoxX family membrane protein n=1 Tax=Christiangramia sp. TaxID=1931228 RepID=UPI0026323E2F|nr:DoxX family membrane protein [Christiangramia sp.]